MCCDVRNWEEKCEGFPFKKWGQMRCSFTSKVYGKCDFLLKVSTILKIHLKFSRGLLVGKGCERFLLKCLTHVSKEKNHVFL